MSTLNLGTHRATLSPLRLRGLGWVTWRQHRIALAGVVIVLGGFSVLLVVNGLSTRHAYDALGLNRCGSLTGPACQTPLGLLRQGYALQLPRILEFLPGLIGVFVGAPLVARELESGTFRFAWTQGRTPLQWITVKLAILAAALTALALAFSALFGWWFAPWDPIMGQMTTGQAYEVAGLVFAARTLFAFALGAWLGAVIRRTVPAMAATAAGWLAVVWPSTLYLRPLIEKPINVLSNSNLIANGWAIHDWVQDPSGHHLTATQLARLAVQGQAQASREQASFSFYTWLARHGYTQWSSYQPNSRFWHFQTIESAAYVLLAVAFGAATIWWARRRRADLPSGRPKPEPAAQP